MQSLLLVLIVVFAASKLSESFSSPVPSTSRWSQLRMAGDEASSNDESPPVARTEPVVCPDCDICDGSGRIAGGIGALIPWIPIKAYRPCPNFLERGGIYQRSGQGLDEIAFGRDKEFGK